MKEKWLTNLFLILILLFWFGIVWKYSRDLPELPPGDFQRDTAITHNILAGIFLGDAAYKGEYNWYPPLSQILYAFYHKITGIPVEFLYLSYPFFLSIPTLFLAFLSFGKIFKWSILATLGLFLLIFVFPMPAQHLHVISHPFDLAIGTFLLGIYLFWQAINSEKTKDFILAGIGVGLAVLSQPFVAFVLCGGIGFYQILTRKNWRQFFLTVGVSFLISSFYILPLILKYRLTPINTTNIAFAQSELTLDRLFYGFGGLRWFNCFLIYTGILVAIYRRKKSDIFFLCLFFFSLFFVVLGLVTTQLGPPFSNIKLPSSLVWQDIKECNHIVAIFLLIIGFCYWMEEILIRLGKKLNQKSIFWVTIFLIAVYIPSTLPRFVNRAKGWYSSQAIYFPYTADWQAITAWIKKNTSINDVFLAHSGPSYLFIGGMTGRKVVVTDKWHSNPFVDQRQRMEDHQTMFQTPDLDYFLRLAKKYEIDYVIISQYEKDFAGRGIDKFFNPELFIPVFRSGDITIYSLLIPT